LLAEWFIWKAKELIAAGDEDGALFYLKEVLRGWPDSPAAKVAKKLLDALGE
jgi:hypothetical protein